MVRFSPNECVYTYFGVEILSTGQTVFLPNVVCCYGRGGVNISYNVVKRMKHGLNLIASALSVKINLPQLHSKQE
jgi:hypothetical protein